MAKRQGTRQRHEGARQGEGAEEAQVSWRSTPLPRDWKRTVARIKQRDPYCVECLAIGRYTLTTDIHHVGDPADHSDANLVGLCAWHHGRHTSAKANASRVRVTQRREQEKHPGLL